METLKGHVAIISGGAGDIGGAIALELAERGSDVAIGDLKNPEEVQALLSKIEDRNVRPFYTQLDISQSEAVKKWVENVETRLGTPDIIISCAAQATFENTRTITPEQWDRELQVNLNGAFYLAQAGALRLLEVKRPGNIIFIGSTSGIRIQPLLIAYSVSKAAVHALAKGVALDFAPHGIKVNALSLGTVYAGMSRRYYEEHPEDILKDTAAIPSGQLIEAEEIAWHVANLCDPRNKNLTGAVLPIDGGISLLPDFRYYRGK